MESSSAPPKPTTDVVKRPPVQPPAKRVLPTVDELFDDDAIARLSKLTEWEVLLNQNPPEKWLKPHPMATRKNSKGKWVPTVYLPIERVEYLLTAMYLEWSVEIRDSKQIAQSILVVVRLYVKNPITGMVEWNDGIGAAPLQTDAGAAATDHTAIKPNAVQIGAPAAESYAVKDAAEKFGKVFGKDLNRDESISYDALHGRFDKVKDTRAAEKKISQFTDITKLLAWAMEQPQKLLDTEEFTKAVDLQKKKLEQLVKAKKKKKSKAKPKKKPTKQIWKKPVRVKQPSKKPVVEKPKKKAAGPKPILKWGCLNCQTVLRRVNKPTKGCKTCGSVEFAEEKAPPENES